MTTTWAGEDVLVTGASGFIGSRLVEALLERGATVFCLVPDHDPLSPLWLDGAADRVHLVTGRLERFDDVKAAIIGRDVTTVFHLGAQTLVGVARRDPLGTIEANVRGTAHVLEACRLAGRHVRRIVVASSDKAYGECGDRVFDETTPLRGRFPYDVSKACADLIAQSYAATYDLPVAIARCGNVFGPGDLNWSRIVPGTLRALLRGERPVIRSDGSPVRDYLAVDDAVAAYLALAAWLDCAGPAERVCPAFNFSLDEPMTVLEMTAHIRAAAGREDLEPLIEGTATAEIHAQRLDSSRARRELDWMPGEDVRSALRSAVPWYRNALSRLGLVPPPARRAASRPAAILSGARPS